MGACNFVNIPHINVPKYYGGKVCVFWQETFKLVTIFLSGSRNLPYFYGFFEAVNTLMQERHYHRERRITVKMSRRTQNVEIYLAIERARLSIFCTGLGHIFGIIVGLDFGILVRGKNIVSDRTTPLLHCFPFTSKLKAVITTGHCMNYQTIFNLPFRPLLKNFFHSNDIDLRDTSGKNYTLYLSVSLVLFWYL